MDKMEVSGTHLIQAMPFLLVLKVLHHLWFFSTEKIDLDRWTEFLCLFSLDLPDIIGKTSLSVALG